VVGLLRPQRRGQERPPSTWWWAHATGPGAGEAGREDITSLPCTSARGRGSGTSRRRRASSASSRRGERPRILRRAAFPRGSSAPTPGSSWRSWASRPWAPPAGLHLSGGERPPPRDLPGPGRPAVLHPPRRAVAGIDPPRRPRHPEDHRPPAGRGIGILITDHNVRETLKITDRAYILRDGDVFRSGTPTELASDSEVRRVYLGRASAWTAARPERSGRGRSLDPCPAPEARPSRAALPAAHPHPSLQQAIKLLPSRRSRLAEVLEQESWRTPSSRSAGRGDEDERGAGAGGAAAGTGAGRGPAQGDRGRALLRGLLRRRRGAPHEAGRSARVPPIENTLTESPDLYDHLLWQLRMTEADEATLEIGEAIIQNLDEDGLLRVSLEDVAAMGAVADGSGGEDAGPWCRPSTRRGGGADAHRVPAHPAACLGLEGSPADVMVRDHISSSRATSTRDLAADGLTADEVAHHLEIIQGSPRGPATATAPSARTTSCPTCSW